MGSLTRSINFELPHNLHFDKYAQQVLENSSKTAAAETSSMHASTPTITTLDDLSSSDFLQKIGASILSSIQLKHKLDAQTTDFQHQSTLNAVNTNMDLDFTPNRVVIDSSSFSAMDELQKQLEYDKFMNEVWIGIVFTLILISMIFCICSCFLYHQFRTWKRNYHSTATQCASANDVEALKLQPDLEDPVPEYTLVSGLPSYEAALELLHKTPQSCLIVYPSVFNVFNKHERGNVDGLTTAAAAVPGTPTATANAAQQHHLCDVTMPLLAPTTTTTTPTTATTIELNGASLSPLSTSTPTREVIKPSFVPIPSYSEAMSYKTIDEKSSASASAILTPTPTQTTTATLARSNNNNNNKSENSLLTLTHKNQSDKC